MNQRIRSLVATAESELSAADQDSLADVLEAFLEARGADGDFSPEEMVRLREIDREPFIPADPEEFATLFRRFA